MITLHRTILNRFDCEIVKIRKLIDQLKPYESISKPIASKLIDLNNKINIDCNKSIFIAETCEYINEYKLLLRNPITREKKCSITASKTKIEQQYLNAVKRTSLKMKWYDIYIDDIYQFKKDLTECPTCENVDKTLFEIDDVGRRTCINCFRIISTFETGNGHMDFNRATVTGKFIYNRVLHFQDCIKQFQGKQNCKIPQTVYDHLNKLFSAYRLLVDSNDKRVKYSKITKQHVLMFLKDYPKQYENVNVIYITLTGKSGEDIGYLENQLIEDFKELVMLYDTLHSKDRPEELDRKNFLNVQYILFQLLRKHGHDCKPEDFSMLKTTERKLFHDQVCSNLFSKLGWNFSRTF